VDIKQIRIEELVTAYFNQRGDTSAHPIKHGRYRVRLLSDTARIEFGRGRSDDLILIFDTDEAYRFKDAELISSNHPLLDTIRNDLEKRVDQDPRICEAYAPIQIVNPLGNIVIPGLEFTNIKNPQIGYTLNYIPFYVFTYQVVYEMDGGSENIVRVNISGDSGQEIEDLYTKVNELTLISGRPENITQKQSGKPFLQIRDKSRDLIRRRTAEDLQSVSKNISEQLKTEAKRIKEYYQNEINKLNGEDNKAAVSTLETAQNRELEEWQKKLAFRVKITPLSIKRVWIPNINYELRISGAKDKFTFGNIEYLYGQKEAAFLHCSKCGNSRTYKICITGQHIVCDGECGEKTEQCKVCHDDHCSKHGGYCKNCQEAICESDSQRCAYGSHERRDKFCPDCLVESFEGKPLCVLCDEICETCKRHFSKELMATCRIGSEHICVDHKKKPDGFQCAECGEYTCSDHGSLTETKEWACGDHQSLSTCCGKKYRKSLLRNCCCDSNELICPVHAVKCFECDKIVCESHRYPLADHRGLFVCEKCRKTCSECAVDKSYVGEDLLSCSKCRKKLCAAHKNVCAVGSEVLCKKHALHSEANEILCEAHADYCIQTGAGEGSPIYRSDELVKCAVCSQSVCSKHKTKCKICKNQICASHLEGRPICASCGNQSCGSRGCNATSHKCKYCGMAYCRNCITEKGICTACEKLLKSRITDPEKWLIFLLAISKSIGEEKGRILREILTTPDKLILWAASNHTYSVVVIRYTPGFFESLWKKKYQFRLVVSKDGKLKKIINENAG
jgi:hypothetical protein